MEKFEKHIKQNFNKRELKPSQEAWQRIERSLDENQNAEPKRKPIYWYAAAAILVGFLVSTLFYFNSDEGELQPNNNDIVVSKNDTVVQEIVVNKEKPKPIEKVSEFVEPVPMQTKEETSLLLKENELAISIETKPLSNMFPKPQQLLIDQKVDEVFDKVMLLEHQNKALTDTEVDSLLKAAQRAILADKIFEPEGSVDAMALLTQVEDELDKSFRDNIFNALKEGYTKLRTAVADRNK